MYFLVKNVRTCARPLKGSPNTLKIYRNGILNKECLTKNMSFFLIHPEQLKQKLKEQDAHMLCQFFDSEEYKRRVTSFLETQSKILSKESITGAKKIQYQHVLSCAQPAHRKVRFCVEPEEKKVIKVNEPKSKKAKKGTIFEQLIKRKTQMEAAALKEPDVIQIVKKDTSLKKMRHRTTIMPIFLKKMKKKQAQVLENEDNPNLPGLHMQTARKIPLPDEEPEPLYAQILHRSNVNKKGPKTTSKPNPRPPQKAQKTEIESTPSPSEKESYMPPKKEKKIFQMQNLLHKVKENSLKMEEVPQKPITFRINQGSAIVDLKKDPLNSESKSQKSDHVAFGTSKLEHVSYRLSKANSKVEDVSLKLGGPSQIGQVPLRMSSSTAKGITTKLCPKKNINMNLKSYSDLLCVEPVRLKATTKKKSKKHREVPGKTLKMEALKKSERKHEVDNGELAREKLLSLQKLMENVHKSRSLELEDNLERKNTMVAVAKRKNVQVKKKRRLQVLSLFEKVKNGSAKNTQQSSHEATEEIKPENLETKVVFQPKLVKSRKKESANGPSCTYKIVSKHRERLDEKLKEKFALSPPFWKNTFSFRLGLPAGKSKKVKVDDGSTKTTDVLNMEEQRSKFGIVAKNIPKNLHRPVPHFVEHADKPTIAQLNPYAGTVLSTSIASPLRARTKARAFSVGLQLLPLAAASNCRRYLLRLPKSTPEGYRILMYAVRDPDPTKMNFNDVVKGFCMYNDCVLSEDGLQEGYIVIFDMKDVGIGHLARVSLPALKCFMYYIQDAHPCRLKQIHVLNTCSWIHHIMRLVVPLVRSEILSLVRFHKGNVPDNFPVELLPMDYGGEAPTVDDLDRTTKSLLNRYRHWLVESSQLKADEAKRTKKASWWGLFSNKSPQQNELDEKTILRNLQID